MKFIHCNIHREAIVAKKLKLEIFNVLHDAMILTSK